MNFDDPHDLAAIAGEYVLGTLDEADRLAVESEMVTRAALRAEIARWRDRLLGLSNRAPQVAPSSNLWDRIEQSISAGNVAAAPTRVSPTPPIADTSSAGRAARSTAAANEPFWQRVGIWRSISGLALAACLAMSVLLVGEFRGETPTRYIAVLQSPDKLPGWLVETSTSGPLKLIPLTNDTAAPEGRSLQFWTKLDGAAGPTSLGIVRAGRPIEVDLSKLPGVAGNQLFEITLEPPNGSPLNKPTGPVLFIGRSVKV